MNDQTFPSRLKKLLSKTVLSFARKSGLSHQMMTYMFKEVQSPSHKQKAFRGYQPTTNDLFVCNFAKSGTNWIMQIAQQIAYYGEAEFDHIHDLVSWPDAPSNFDAVSLTDPLPQQKSPTGYRIIKTHLETDYVPYNGKAKYVLAIRDPKDVIVSSYHFSKPVYDMFGLPHDPTNWFRDFIMNRTVFGSWPAHTASYWAWRNRPNVLLFTFREMKQDLPAVCQKIASLMQVNLSDEQLEKVIAKSQFQYMKQVEEKFTPRLAIEGEKPAMIREGKVGVGSTLFTDKQQANLDTFCQMKLDELNSDFPYEAVFVEKSLTILSDENKLIK